MAQNINMFDIVQLDGIISYVSIQSVELNLCAKLEYRIKHLRIKHRFHPTSQREQIVTP